MKKIFMAVALLVVSLAGSVETMAQFKLGKAINAATKGVQALTLTDEQMAEYVKEAIDWMDKNNPVPGENDPYTQRLRRLTADLKEVDGIPLNFKVYDVIDVNAFACPDGSVRVFSSLMDIMSDDELLGVIGHEIGHVGLRHSKKAFKQELLTGALRDGVAATGGKAAALTESALGDMGQALVGAKFSQKQEKEADMYGYEFLKKNGKNPWGMVMSFEKLLEMEGNGNAKSSWSQKMFSSHPETKDRIKKLSERAQKEGIARPAK